jgi:hypothetical protein
MSAVTAWQRSSWLALYALGAALCIPFLQRMAGWPAWAAAVAALTSLQWLVGRPDAPAARTRSRGLALLVLRLFDLLVIFLAVAWGGALWWATSWWLRLLVLALVALWLMGFRRRQTRWRIPLVLPVGVWITACLSGWLRAETFLPCDDLARLQAPVSLLMATTDTASCIQGGQVPIGRYPRKFWQSPDGRWLRFTTQRGGLLRRGRFAGLVCELDLAAPAAAPRCVGPEDGKSHGIVGADHLGKVFVAAWSLRRDKHGLSSAIYTLPQEGPITIEAEHRFDAPVADMLIEPQSGTMHIFTDTNDRIITVQLPSFERKRDSMGAIFPAQVHYDPDRDEGVVCGWLGGVAIRARPLATRYFGIQAPSPWAWLALSWGCDWDPEKRRVYATAPNLGLLYEIDYDSGRILRKHWVGFGMRTTTLDRRRGLLYVLDFLRGDILAFDTASGEIRHRWFVGRFVRDAYLSRDRRTLFASSNLGVVTIALPG